MTAPGPREAALQFLLSLGYTDIEQHDESVWEDGRTRLLFRHTNGDPMDDLPVILVDDRGRATMLPWTAAIRPSTG